MTDDVEAALARLREACDMDPAPPFAVLRVEEVRIIERHIEALTAENERSTHLIQTLAAQILDMQAERNRLEAALERIQGQAWECMSDRPRDAFRPIWQEAGRALRRTETEAQP